MLKMKKALRLLAAAALCATSTTTAFAKDVIKFATQQDPVFIAAAYPITSGKVTSDVVDIEFSFLNIAGLNQAPATRQYDVIHTASLSVPRGAAQGLDMSVIAISNAYPDGGDGANIWVAEDSPYQSIEDLEGKTIGTYGLNSGGFTNMRQVLALKHGYNVDLENGDFRFVEMPAPVLPAALEAGRIDAATLVHAQIFKAKQSGGFRSVLAAQSPLNEMLGGETPSIVLAAYNDRLAESPESYKAFLELLQESMAYLKAHQDEIFAAVGEEQNIDPDYFRMWFAEFGVIPYALTENDARVLEESWENSVKIGALETMPDVKSLIWTDAIGN